MCLSFGALPYLVFLPSHSTTESLLSGVCITVIFLSILLHDHLEWYAQSVHSVALMSFIIKPFMGEGSEYNVLALFSFCTRLESE